MRLRQKTVLEYTVPRTSLRIIMVTTLYVGTCLTRVAYDSIFACFSKLDCVLWRLGYIVNAVII